MKSRTRSTKVTLSPLRLREHARAVSHFLGTVTISFLIVGLECGPATSDARTNYQRLKSFGVRGATEFAPLGLIEGSDGKLYGTLGGGTNDAGTVFKLNKDGSGYTILRWFTGTGGDGASPSGLVEGQDGVLYGTTLGGGTNDAGTVFKLNRDGSGYSVLRRFTGIANQDGS